MDREAAPRCCLMGMTVLSYQNLLQEPTINTGRFQPGYRPFRLKFTLPRFATPRFPSPLDKAMKNSVEFFSHLY